MPDWSYQTLFRPLLFRMAPRTAQQFAVGSLGRIGSLPYGKHVVSFMGHMTSDPLLAFDHQGVHFPSRVALGVGLDSLGKATAAFDQFSFAFIEYGPLTPDACHQSPVELNEDTETITLTSPEQNPGLAWLDSFSESANPDSNSTPIFVRFDRTVSAEEIRERISQLPVGVAGMVIPIELWNDVVKPLEVTQSKPLLLVLVGADTDPSSLTLDSHVDGVVVDGGLSIERSYRKLSKSNLEPTCRAVSNWRQYLGVDPLIIASGGVHEPADSLRVIQSGANIVAVESGMVVAGPGLAKRCNELLAQTEFRPQDRKTRTPVADDEVRATRESWFWSMLMGISMLGGGIMALVIAMTRVVLPYDESTVGMTREELMLVNDRLIDFMAHDRATLAGTMLCLGTLYTGLSVFGMRFGAHWAGKSIVVSAFAGFFSFFLFLGFGYFDPFHAFVTAILFQFLLLTVYARLANRRHPVCLDPHNDRRWKLAQWGQLMYLCQGGALIVAGSIISTVGITSVFVKEDMEFLCTTSDRLIEANPQLLSLVAHDRATFGGMLICSGITILLAALWGFRRGHRWLWWTLFMGGLFGYICTIVIHHRVGYVDVKHLLPAYGGLIWHGGAAWLSYAYLHDKITRL